MVGWRVPVLFMNVHPLGIPSVELLEVEDKIKVFRVVPDEEERLCGNLGDCPNREKSASR